MTGAEVTIPTGLAIHRLLAGADHGPAAVEAFLDAHPWPLIEGAHVTFACTAADVERVWLRHQVTGLPGDLAMNRMSGSDLWWTVLEIPGDSRVEYQFETRSEGEWRRWNDPRNPRIARSPVGDSSVAWGPAYTPAAWTRPDPEARTGELVELSVPSRALGRTQRVTVYLPARMRGARRYPLLVVHDGSDFREYAAMRTVVDNLIHRLDMAEVIIAFTDPGDRLAEYAASADHGRWIAEELVPWLESELPLIGAPEARTLMGSSFGGVASFATACQYPGRFGSLLVQSGSFVFTDIAFDHGEDPAFDPVVAFMNSYRMRPRAVVDQMFVSCGRYEPLIVHNRSMLEVWRQTGMRVRYVESRDGHNWESWRDRLRDGLGWLFPGDRMLTYE